MPPFPPLTSLQPFRYNVYKPDGRSLTIEAWARAEEFAFPSGSCKDSPEGYILGFGLEEHELWDALKGGQAFQTSGCPGCNRPYYNERPGGPLYNYPRPLTSEEVEKAIEEAWKQG